MVALSGTEPTDSAQVRVDVLRFQLTAHQGEANNYAMSYSAAFTIQEVISTKTFSEPRFHTARDRSRAATKKNKSAPIEASLDDIQCPDFLAAKFRHRAVSCSNSRETQGGKDNSCRSGRDGGEAYAV